MSHKTHYKTFSQPDLQVLEQEVNDYIRSLQKDEKIDRIKINNITTFNVNNNFIAAVTHSYTKKKKPVAEVVATDQGGSVAGG